MRHDNIRTGRLHGQLRFRLAVLWVAAVSCLFSAPAFASDLGPVFRTLSVNEGLPDRRAEAIVQDAQGFIWIGTRGGLVRHDGETMRFIGSDPERPNPLPGRNIMSLMAHSSGSVWAAVENRGVVEIAPDLNLVRHLDAGQQRGRLPAGNIWSMTEDCRGRVWMAFMRGGVAVYDPTEDSLVHYPQNAASGLDPAGFQVHLERDSKCRLWLVQTGQIASFDSDSNRFRALDPGDEKSVSMHLAEVDGRIYFNLGQELFTLGPTEHAPEATPRRVTRVEGVITAIDAAPEDSRLVVASTSGLGRVDPSGKLATEHIAHRPGLANGLPSDTVDGLLIDREGGLWLTTTRSGVAYLPPGSAAFQRYQPVVGKNSPQYLETDPVLSLAWDAKLDGFWVGGLGGELEFLSLGDATSSVDIAAVTGHEGLAGVNVVEILREPRALYVATQTRILRFDLDGSDPELLMRRERVDDGTFSLLRRKDADSLWVGTRDRGLFVYDERGGRHRHIDQLPETSPRKLLRGPGGDWWLVAPGGLYRWDEQSGFQRQQWTAAAPLAAAAWQGNDLWLATDAKLEQWRVEQDRFSRVRALEIGQRLPPGRMIDLIPDRSGAVWLLRSSGLSRLSPGGGGLRNLSERDGLAAVEFGENASTVLPDGRLAFAGRGGIVTVDPERLSRVAVAPPVHITRVQAGDLIRELTPGRPARRLTLAHDHNTVFFDYRATSYLAPSRTRYRVQLEGWDADWIELIGQTRHHYSNLPPGTYRFRVQAAAPGGPWSRSTRALPLTVQPPPWLSDWAIGAYLLLAVSGAGLGWRGYRRSHQRRREMREAQHKRALAEAQRRVMTRLNHSLEPQELAATVAAVFRELAEARCAWFGYLDEQLPRELIAAPGQAQALTRERWLSRLESADGRRDLAVTLRVADRAVARVLVDRPGADFHGDQAQRLELLAEVAGQTLHNALLLQQVRTLAERAEQANQAKSEFLATMSHEIRTPLHGVLGMVELLCDGQVDSGQQDIVDTLKHSGRQLQRIIDDVLDISRIEAGRLRLDSQPFELTAVLEQVVDLHAANAAQKGLDLRLRLASDLPVLARGDSDRLVQVIGNLLSNAVKFTRTGGIEVSADTGYDGYLVLVVADSGPGIDQTDRDRLFEPFTQLDASITRSHSGSGLGLAICRRLVHAMDGQLDLLEACHAGSRFRVRLPLLASSESIAPGSISRLLDGLRVAACVCPSTLRILRRLGRRWGMTVIDARRGLPVDCALLLVDPRCQAALDAGQLDAWRTRAAAVAWLQSPFASANDPSRDPPAEARFLRWPLVESRFIGLLLDLRFADDDARAPSS